MPTTLKDTPTETSFTVIFSHPRTWKESVLFWLFRPLAAWSDAAYTSFPDGETHEEQVEEEQYEYRTCRRE